MNIEYQKLKEKRNSLPKGSLKRRILTIEMSIIRPVGKYVKKE